MVDGGAAMSRLRRSRTAPRVLWLAARITAPVSARLSSASAAALWFVPWQHRAADPDHLAELGPPRTLSVGGHEVVVHDRGEGTGVLLVHGWADRAASMAAFVGPLAAAGHRVVTVDLPAHGAAPGRWTAGPQMAAVIAGLVERFEVDAVVAHSLGGLVTSRALQLTDAASVRRLVLLSPPLRIGEALTTFGHEARLPSRTRRALEDRMQRRFTSSVWDDFAADRNLAGSHLDGLIVHDTDDRRVDVDDARRLQATWPRARLLETQGLGHTRLLRTPLVVEAVVGHVQRGGQPSIA
jgi:pimeloyl-ACP methyl ester carboxylesterase